MPEQLGRILLFLGIFLVVLGLVFIFGGRFNLGRLPGDIVVERENFIFYFPLMTGLLISVALSALLYLFGKYFR